MKREGVTDKTDFDRSERQGAPFSRTLLLHLPEKVDLNKKLKGDGAGNSYGISRSLGTTVKLRTSKLLNGDATNNIACIK